MQLTSLSVFVFIQAFVFIEGSGQGCITSIMAPSKPVTNCVEWASANDVTRDKYTATIDPDGLGTDFSEVNVTCIRRSTTGEICTKISPDPSFSDIDGYEEPLSYRLDITYDIGLEAVKKIADDAKRCYQLISYECYGSALSKSNVIYVAWENRSMEQSEYFTGNGSGNYYCNCEEDCSSPGGCFCNLNDEMRRMDHGFITNKGDLPITAFKAGDTGFQYTIDGTVDFDEEAIISIGDLVCCY